MERENNFLLVTENHFSKVVKTHLRANPPSMIQITCDGKARPNSHGVLPLDGSLFKTLTKAFFEVLRCYTCIRESRDASVRSQIYNMT
jgi:hypothetical protein